MNLNSVAKKKRSLQVNAGIVIKYEINLGSFSNPDSVAYLMDQDCTHLME